MPVLDARTASLEILTEADGLLSVAAHDLRLRADELEITVDDALTSIEARVPAAKVRVVTARRGDRDLPMALSSGDRATIDRHLHEDVLNARRFPQIRFHSTSVERDADRIRVAGLLSLHGVERPVSFVAQRAGAHYGASIPVDQREFGIRPFTAFLGGLKVRPTVVIRVSVPVPETA